MKVKTILLVVALLVSLVPSTCFAAEVVEAVVCRDVQDRQPVGESDSFPADVGRVWCWSKIKDGQGTTITHAYYYAGEEKAVVPLAIRSPLFRILGAIGILFGLFVPIFGGRPVWIMIASQAFQATIMPMVTITMIILLNRKDIMGKHTIGFWMNLGCWLTFIFSLVMAYTGIVGLKDFF